LSASRLTRKRFASWEPRACSCARSSPRRAQNRQVLECPVLYRSGAPDKIRTCDLCLRRAWGRRILGGREEQQVKLVALPVASFTTRSACTQDQQGCATPPAAPAQASPPSWSAHHAGSRASGAYNAATSSSPCGR